MTRDCLDKTLSLGHGHGQTGHCNWNNSGYHKCIFSIIKMLWVLSIYGIIQIYCFVLCTYNISQQKYTSAINVLQSIFTEIKNVCRGQQSMMLMEAPPGARSWTAERTVEGRSGSQQAAALPPNKSVLIVSTSARPGINRHSAYQHSYQHAANQEHCTCTCTWLSIFNVVIKVAQSCVAVNICNTQGSRITHSHHPPIVWLSVWLYLSGLLPGSPH